MLSWFLPAVTVLLCSCGTHYYVVRHAEKEVANTMTSDVPLSAAGKERAEALKKQLRHKRIKSIFSTNTLRTLTTVKPLSTAIDVPVQIYSRPDSSFIRKLKALNGNTLISAHANTVDDLVNGLTGKTQLRDLPDKQYGDLFIVHKKGRKTTFRAKRFGE